MLKSLELFGFKSFADRTLFDFSSGITGIVGPNGSGKSNVVDGIKWILGDQSAKSLRGKEMTDVIFNGASGRKPSGFAEATLCFDNTTRFLGIEADEVQVGRRLYRSGESEYLINNAPARLKDVRDLLMGTGTGAYSIIEQGRVDQLLQSSNVNRRAVFEEAAGVSRFKARKIDAQRKLERVDQNLLRLKDIVQELGGRLNTMRQQAKKASRYRKYSSELRELRVGFAADEYRELTEQLGAISQSHDGWQAEIDELKAKATEIEQQQAALDIRLTKVEDALQESQQRTAGNR
jgi:chromosome segregation protein